jgi:ABC-type Fe3+/spermidine/putrescine transport system ATPase subunit
MEVVTNEAIAPGTHVTVSVRPEHVQVGIVRDGDGSAGKQGVFAGTVSTQVFLGYTQDLEIDLPGVRLQARVHPSLEYPIGAPVAVTIDPQRCIICR